MGEKRVRHAGRRRIRTTSGSVGALGALRSLRSLGRHGTLGVLGTLVAVLGVLALPALLLANGGTLRVADAPVGAYRVSVYTDPTPPRPDSVDVSVLVVRENDPTPVPDLEIVVRAVLLGSRTAPPGPGTGTPAGDPADAPDPAPDASEGASSGPSGPSGADGVPRTLRATRDQADDPRYYAAKFAPGVDGPWRFDVDVRGPEGQGTVSFQLRVREPGLLDRPWVVVGLALVPLALLAFWLLRDGREQSDRSGPDPSVAG